MNILVTGSNGQLGNEMRVLSALHAQHRFFFTDVEELDITNIEAIEQFVTSNNINCIVNCAAYTNVDRAEEDEPTAFLINATAVSNLGKVAATHNLLLVHISTDYVFNGKAFKPYKESDPTDPQTAYGRTKLKGEQLLHQVCPQAVVIRTAWLYSSFGNNFVKTMLRLGKEKDQLNVVFDQIGSPTYAADLAWAIMLVVNHPPQGQHLIFHFTNEGVCSWYDFTKEIHRIANINCNVMPILSEQYTYKTPRPHYSVLDKQKFKTTFSVQIPHWQVALKACMDKLKENAES
ncbi:MAG: dTDP-4-dehydrorhamnose reductase [Paludibacteraceae bacterium]|nr:dTDP-4-dehydrorhamnose reductase [Paludibacteraceae bacterium]